MFYIVFGGAWIAVASWRTLTSPALAMTVAAAVTACLFTFVYLRFRQHSAALAGEPDSPDKQRRDKWFHIVNAGQWIVILIVGNVLANIGLGAWVIAAAIFVVGLHFFPLAKILDNPRQYVTGTAFVVLACVFPFVTPEGPQSGVGPLGAGLILWASALWNVQ